MLLVSLIVGIAICFGVPIAGLVLLMRKRRGAGKAFALGAAAFVVSQLLIRIPLLQLVLPNFSWFAVMQLYPWRYGLFLGLTAGLAEETARWIAARYLLKGKDTMEHGLAFGLGHGGIEAMLLVGLNMIAGVVMALYGIFRTAFDRRWRAGIWFGGTGTALVVMVLFFLAGYRSTAYYPSVLDAQSSLSIANSSSSLFTLKVMSWVSVLVPFVLAYIAYVWRKMNAHPLTPSELHREHHQY